ncbi:MULTISPECIES: hypothetical protein [Methylobacterium]|uniref:hypothetical protein n=1 Tax=Methylobacterium TaxID=407 RepID=UPI002F35A0D5
MAPDHPCFEQPSDLAVKLWRYMDLGKFINMLQSQSLYFRRIDSFEDSYEGYPSKPMKDRAAEMAQFEFDRSRGRLPADLTSEHMKEIFDAMFLDQIAIRNQFFANCWHMADEESAAMWRLYTAQNEAIAIQCEYQDLKSALPEYCYIGKINYIDYKTDNIGHGNVFRLVTHKRKSFEHEKEVRAVIWSMGRGKRGVSWVSEFGATVHIDIRKLIKNIYVSPKSEDLLLSVVQGLADIYGLSVKVLKSEVNAPPAW